MLSSIFRWMAKACFLPMHDNQAPSKWVMSTLASYLDTHANRPLTMVDIACGSGRHIIPLLDQHPSALIHILAIDRDQHALTKLPIDSRLESLCFDLESPEFPLSAYLQDRQFDIVLTSNYLYRPLLPYLFTLTSMHGLFVYETFADGNEQFGKPSNPDYLLQENELRSHLPGNFKEIEFFRGQRQLIDPQSSPAIIQHLSAYRL